MRKLALLSGVSALGLALHGASAMAQTVKIPQLPDAGALGGSEYLIVDQNASTRKTTVDLLTAYALAHLTAQQVDTALGFAPLPASGGNVTGALTVQGLLGLPSIPALDLTYTSTPNPNAIRLGAGISLSICPALSCIDSPSDSTAPTPSFFDHQRASALFSAVTGDDSHSEEQTLAVLTTVATGYAKPYAANTAYAVGDNVAVGNAVYRAVVAGTTGANSAPPSTRPTAAQGGAYRVVDGSVTWQWINDQAIASKVGAYIETQIVKGAGQSWGAAFNTQMQPGSMPTFNLNVEFDWTNNSGTDCLIGQSNCNNLYIATSGTNKSTAGLALTTANAGSVYGAYFGLRLNGAMLASDDDIEDDSSGGYAIGICTTGFATCKHAQASIADASTSPAFLVNTGAHTTGIGSLLFDTGSSTNGIWLNGTYASYQVLGKGWTVDPSGNINASTLSVGGQLTESSTVLIKTTTPFSNNSGSQTATLTNGPTAGNPTKWVPINDNGTIRYMPAW